MHLPVFRQQKSRTFQLSKTCGFPHVHSAVVQQAQVLLQRLDRIDITY